MKRVFGTDKVSKTLPWKKLFILAFQVYAKFPLASSKFFPFKFFAPLSPKESGKKALHKAIYNKSRRVAPTALFVY
jgi:hypothetical protein